MPEAIQTQITDTYMWHRGDELIQTAIRPLNFCNKKSHLCVCRWPNTIITYLKVHQWRNITQNKYSRTELRNFLTGYIFITQKNHIFITQKKIDPVLTDGLTPNGLNIFAGTPTHWPLFRSRHFKCIFFNKTFQIIFLNWLLLWFRLATSQYVFEK